MPPAKKAAKKAAKHAAKKAAKKSPSHHGPGHKEGKDLRRAFEHLGRIEALQPSVPRAAQPDVAALVALAQQQLNQDLARNAAELLRAAEHVSFASLAATVTVPPATSRSVQQTLESEYAHLAEKAKERWTESTGRPSVVVQLYKLSVQSSREALARANFREALEWIRAAGALAHVEKEGPDKLPAPISRQVLKK